MGFHSLTFYEGIVSKSIYLSSNPDNFQKYFLQNWILVIGIIASKGINRYTTIFEKIHNSYKIRV